jgi:hypothetical protein
MKSRIGIALFVVAGLSFFLVSRVENQNAKDAIEAGLNSVTTQLSHESAATPPSPAERKTFLLKQQKILAAAKDKKPVAAEPASPQLTSAPAPSNAPFILPYMPIIVTAVFGLAALWVILSTRYKTDEETRKWAFGVLGLIVGYWLKGSS